MKFADLLRDDEQEETPRALSKARGVLAITEAAETVETAQEPERILRGAGYKIKLITKTSFGTQIDFAKKYDEEEVKKILTDFTVKIKNKSVFIVD